MTHTPPHHPSLALATFASGLCFDAIPHDVVALHGYAGVDAFEREYAAADVAAFRERVTMAFDDEVDRAYPARWIGKVTVKTRDGRSHAGRVDEPKGDPGNTLSRAEIADKVRRLARFSGAASQDEVARLVAGAWDIASQEAIGSLFQEESA